MKLQYFFFFFSFLSFYTRPAKKKQSWVIRELVYSTSSYLRHVIMFLFCISGREGDIISGATSKRSDLTDRYIYDLVTKYLSNDADGLPYWITTRCHSQIGKKKYSFTEIYSTYDQTERKRKKEPNLSKNLIQKTFFHARFALLCRAKSIYSSNYGVILSEYFVKKKKLFKSLSVK